MRKNNRNIKCTIQHLGIILDCGNESGFAQVSSFLISMGREFLTELTEIFSRMLGTNPTQICILTAAAALASSFVAFLCRTVREMTELSSEVSREKADMTHTVGE